MPRRKLEKGEYTVGWICALPQPEWKASRILLDEVHEDVSLGHGTTHQYVYGSMNGHNVVMGCLPVTQIGTASAASVATEMTSTFPSLRFGLLVGVGGGVPGKKDVRLGDVVVSQPDPAASHGGVIQYDFGKAIHGGEFQTTGMLNQPPEILLSALSKVQSTPRKESHFDQYLNHEDFDDEPEFAERPDTDRLFYASYRHVQVGPLCTDCDNSQVIERKPRKRAGPVVHYGLIASGNQVIKDAAKRDDISSKNHGVLCFEMEAAGLVNRFPCLVIRGICDYCDSHKNKDWQPFAAVAAAAWAKQLLYNIAPSQVEAERSIRDTLQNLDTIIHQVDKSIRDTSRIMTRHAAGQRQQQIGTWLSPPDPSTNHNKAKEQRHLDTGLWFLQSSQYRDWKAQSNTSIWLHGIPGCGKTILSSTIIEDLRKDDCVLYFYFDFNDSSKQSFEKMVRSLVSQLYQQEDQSRKYLNQLYSSCKDGKEQPSTQALVAVLQSILDQDWAKDVKIVLDALDECGNRKGLFSWLASSMMKRTSVLLTSRKEEDIESSLLKWMPAAAVVPIQQKPVDEDIRAVIRNRIETDEELQRWQSMPDVRKEIETKLMNKADGMFRWAACQLDALRQCLDLPSLEEVLSSLPESLDETYERILANIPHGYRRHAVRILQFLTFSERPLRLEEAIDAIAVFPDRTPAFQVRNRMPEPKEIARYCSSLTKITVRTEERYDQIRLSRKREELVTELQLAHFSVKEYFISHRLREDFKQSFRQSSARAVIAQVNLAYLCTAAQDPDNRRIPLPLTRFSAEYWMDHAAIADDSGEDIWPWIEKLLIVQDAFTYWLRAYDPDNEPSVIAGLDHKEFSRESPEDPPAPLYYTSLCGLSKSARHLLAQGANINAQGGRYGNALQAASYKGHSAVVQLLLAEGADVNAQGGELGNALQAASLEGHEVVVQLLLAKDAEVNAQGGPYSNALYAASYVGHEAVVRLLLDKDAEVNTRVPYHNPWTGDDEKDVTAVYIASHRGHGKVVQWLLDKGADANAQGGEYSNALQAASARSHEVVVRLLLSKDADVNAQGGRYGNALQAASHKGHEAVVRLLLLKGANVNAQGGRYGNALQAACHKDHEAVVRLLLSNSAAVNAEGGFYGNALHAASWRGSSDVVQILLDKGANVNTQSGRYRNALRAASEEDHDKVVQLLLDKGARKRDFYRGTLGSSPSPDENIDEDKDKVEFEGKSYCKNESDSWSESSTWSDGNGDNDSDV